MKKVIFLDRDGVINYNNGEYIYSLNNFKFNKGFFEALKFWHNLGYYFAIITNQGGISKGIYKKKDVIIINRYLHYWFKLNNFNLLSILFCPHHNLIENCICRKPNSLMLEKMIAKHDISVKNSFLIGDNFTDIQSGKKVGINSIKIRSNKSLNKVIDEYKYKW